MDNEDTANSQRCPACEAPTRQPFQPFCSRRCKDLDLGRWLRGSYRIPTEEAPAEGDAGVGEGEGDEDDSPFGGRA